MQLLPSLCFSLLQGFTPLHSYALKVSGSWQGKAFFFFFMGGKKLATSSQRLMDKGEGVYTMLELGDTAAKCDCHPHHSTFGPCMI